MASCTHTVKLATLLKIKVVTLGTQDRMKNPLFTPLFPLFQIAMVGNDLQTKKRLGPICAVWYVWGPRLYKFESTRFSLLGR